MDLTIFTEKLIKITVEELNLSADRFANETMKAFNMGCHPWHGYLEPSFLTIDEDFEYNADEKWKYPGNWKLYNFAGTYDDPQWPKATELAEWMQTRCCNPENLQIAAERFFIACAKAITSDEVIKELKKYNLSEDFEIGVVNPDSAEPINYCHTWLVLMSLDL
jgi:hypothetical protein